MVNLDAFFDGVYTFTTFKDLVEDMKKNANTPIWGKILKLRYLEWVRKNEASYHFILKLASKI